MFGIRVGACHIGRIDIRPAVLDSNAHTLPVLVFDENAEPRPGEIGRAGLDGVARQLAREQYRVIHHG